MLLPARCVVALISAALALPAAAQSPPTTPSDVADLVDARAAGGESEMLRRGYINHHAARADDASFVYWWNDSRKQCVRVKTADGRYAQVVQVSNSDCNQSDADSGPGTGAKVALAAAALLGVAALAHKSHHRDDKKLDERQTADFERGYRDALYNHPYHNRGNSRDYTDGYTQGNAERREQSRYRDDNREYRSGYQPQVSVADLRNRDTGRAWREMERRGFSLTYERESSRERLHRFYWNAETRQCIDIGARAGEVVAVSEVSRSSCGH